MTARFVYGRDGGRFVPTGLARGPWDPGAQHGGPVAALLVREIESHDTELPMHLARITVELRKPVPMEPLTVTTSVARPGKRVRIDEAILRFGDTEIARAIATRVRLTAEPLVEGAVRPPDFAGPDAGTDDGWRGDDDMFIGAMDVRIVEGGRGTNLPVRVWMRLNADIVEGERPSPMMRVVAAADFGNGLGSVLDWARYVFINPDLDVATYRPPSGEWVCLDGTSYIDPHGVGVAEAALWDQTGRIGRSTQTLYVDRRSG